MVPRHFCCVFSPRTAAFIMSFVNLVGGCGEFITGVTELCYTKDQGNQTLAIVCVILGIITMINGFILIISIVQAKEKYVLMYLLIGFVNMLILVIYSGINMFEYKWITLVFILCVFLCYGQFGVYSFYQEMSEFNTVNSGAIEIAYNVCTSYVNNVVEEEEAV